MSHTVNHHALVCEGLATYANDAPLQICICRTGRKSLDDFTVVRQDKSNLRMRERSPLHHFLDTRVFRALRAQKLSPSRGVIEQISNIERCAPRVRLRRDTHLHFPPLAVRRSAVRRQVGSIGGNR